MLNVNRFKPDDAVTPKRHVAVPSTALTAFISVENTGPASEKSGSSRGSVALTPSAVEIVIAPSLSTTVTW